MKTRTQKEKQREHDEEKFSADVQTCRYHGILESWPDEYRAKIRKALGEPTHTPTPWEVTESGNDDNGNSFIEIQDENGTSILQIIEGTKPQKINLAKKIVRAVNSHEALTDFIQAAGIRLRQFGLGINYGGKPMTVTDAKQIMLDMSEGIKSLLKEVKS